MTTAPSTSGPLGQPRGIGFGILLFIITLGIYSLYWVFKTQDEVKEHSGIGVGGVLGLVIWILVSPISWFLIPSEIGKMHKARRARSAVHGLDRALGPAPDHRGHRVVREDPGSAQPLLGEQGGRGGARERAGDRVVGRTEGDRNAG